MGITMIGAVDADKKERQRRSKGRKRDRERAAARRRARGLVGRCLNRAAAQITSG